MERLPTDRVILHAMPGTHALRSSLTVDGKTTLVDGIVLEAAIRLGEGSLASGYLFFLTDDVLYEDALTIVLTDAELRTLDAARLGGIYATGAFAGLTLHPPARVAFRFFDERTWSVTLLDRPVSRLPFIGEPAGVHRRFGFSRHFNVAAD